VSTFDITNSGNQPLDVHVSAGPLWLTVVDPTITVPANTTLPARLRYPTDPVTATPQGAPLVAMVHVMADGCAPDSVVVKLTVSDSVASDQVRILPDSLTKLHLTQILGLPAASGGFDVTGESPAVFTADVRVEPPVPWLSVDPTTVSIGGGSPSSKRVQVTVLPDSLPGSQPSVNATVRVIQNNVVQGSDSIIVIVRVLPAPGGMVRVAAAGNSFVMGSDLPDLEAPKHMVTFTYDFFMDSCEVSQGAYFGLMGRNPSQHSGDPARPVESVSWYDAALYCNERSRFDNLDTVYTYTAVNGTPGAGCTLAGLSVHMERVGYRLPTEAEWEYACRAGSGADFFWGNLETADTLDKYLWYMANSANTTHPVATRAPNAFGLFDMAGNVWEWCLDRWVYGYIAGPVTDPGLRVSPADSAMIRGGSYDSDTYGANHAPYEFRSAFRAAEPPGHTFISIGFRCVLPTHVPAGWGPETY
jgi:formylglycine-generating enzyme required for sulfatase activity